MRAEQRAMARRNLDKRLRDWENMGQRPSKGWIRAIRDALGMTTAQLARRMGIAQSRVSRIEEAERSGSITVETLQRAAEAMDCQLVYAFVPEQLLQEMVEKRALRRAKRILAPTRHSMALEDQAVDPADEEAQLRDLARKVLEGPGSALWDDK